MNGASYKSPFAAHKIIPLPDAGRSVFITEFRIEILFRLRINSASAVKKRKKALSQ